MKTTLIVHCDGNVKLVQRGLPPGEYEVTISPKMPVAPNWSAEYERAALRTDSATSTTIEFARVAVLYGKRLRDWELACEALKKLGDGDG